MDRHQCTYNDQVPFPCSGPDTRASFYTPTSVHRLRPADIQIVAAMGDALVTAQGALSTGITTSTHRYYGVTFATGIYIFRIDITLFQHRPFGTT